jgi:hypothetical protein
MAITIWVIGRYEITGTVLQPHAAFFSPFLSDKFWLQGLVVSTWRLLDA